MVLSLRPQDLRSIVQSANVSRRLVVYWMLANVSSRWRTNWQGKRLRTMSRVNGSMVSGQACVSGSIYDHFLLVFRQRCADKLEHLGDVAVNDQRHDDAITQYSAALSLGLQIHHVFIKRSKVHIAKGLWESALDDANQVCPRRLQWDRSHRHGITR